ncbi:cobalamin-binding protein [Prosthecochloris vibrioformis]|nr:cobalamin-binding protein [Prosthecochloris vibrioformis]
MKQRTTLLSLLVLLLLTSMTGCSTRTDTESAGSGTKLPTIVSLAPSITEMVYAVGAGEQLIGRTSACDYPAEVEKVQVVGAFGRPSLEMLLSLSPGIILDADLADEQMGQKISELGLRRERISIQTPDDIPAAIRQIGSLAGHSQQADSLAAVIEKGLEQYNDEAAQLERRPEVYLEIWDDPLWTGGSTSYTSALISYAGGRNIGDAVAKEYFETTPEWVITENPDIIACMYMSRNIPAIEKVSRRPGWEHITAVKEGRIYDNFDNSLFLRPGPRVLEGIAELQELMKNQ